VDSMTGMLSQVRDVMDGHINNVNNISAQIDANKRISPLLYDEISNIDLFPDIQNAIEELKNYKVANSVISNIILFFRESEVVITDSSKYNSNSFFSLYYAWPESSAEEVNRQLSSVEVPIITKSQPIYTDFTLNNSITYMRPLPINFSAPTATLIITIKNSVIEQMIKKVLGNYSGTFYMIDGRGKVITTTTFGEEPIDLEEAQSIIQSIDSQGISEYSAKDNDLLITFAKSKITGWQYAALINSRPILMKVQYVKSTTVKIIFISLIIGTSLAYLFSKGNYRKIKKITDLITKHRQGMLREYKNEWEFIDYSIANYVKENDALQNRLDEQMPVMKNNFFTSLIKGRYTNISQIGSMMQFLDINLGKGPYAIVLLSLNTQKDSKPELTQGVLRITISTASEKFCSDIGNGYAVEVDLDRIAILVSMDKLKAREYEVQLREIGDKIRVFVRDNFGITVTVCLSNECTDLINISKSYTESLTALDYQMIKGKDTVICFNEINNRIHNGYYYSFNQEKQIISYLKIGDFEAIKGILNGVVEAIKHEPISLEVVKCIYFEIVNTAIRALHELGLGFGEIKDHLPSLVNTNTIDEVCNAVCKFYDGICRKVNSNKLSRSDELVENIMSYLSEHFDNKMMSVDLVSDAFDVSPSYLSHIFKERARESFTDYLHGLRLGKARELLITTDSNIVDIGDRVGYNSANNFIRVFKRYEGITPTEYRIAGNIKCKTP
jgi:two-component system, response regulator YesN